MKTFPILKGWAKHALEYRGLIMLLLLVASTNAYAQIAKLDRNINYANLALASVCVVIFTILVVHAGIEIGYHRRKIVDVWPILVGAAISGSGGVIAAASVN